MTIRLKVRILLLVSVSLTVFYIVSHVYRLNNWFTDRSIILKEEFNAGLVKQDEATLHSTSDNLQLNATTNIATSSSSQSEIETLKPFDHDIPTKHQYDNRVIYPENGSEEDTNLRQRDVSPKFVDNTPEGVKDALEVPETSKGSPRSKTNLFHPMNILTNRSDGEINPVPLLATTFPVLDNITDDINDEGSDMEGRNFPTEGTPAKNMPIITGEDDGIVKEETNVDLPLTSKNIPEIPIPMLPPVSSSKIHFKSTSNETSDVETMELDRESILKDKRKLTLTDHCLQNENIEAEKSKIQPKCSLYTAKLDTCAESAKYYNADTLTDPKSCSEEKHDPICSFVNSSRTDSYSKLSLKCNYSMCYKNEVRVGILNATSGKITYMYLNSLKTVVKTLEQETGYDAKDHGADFIFLSCKLNNRKENVHQILPFPPLILKAKRMTTEKKEAPEKININIVVIDSLSRSHFYRTLKKTVKAMKEINQDKSNENFVLDFKGFQSLAPFTYVNLQALLTGSVDFESVTKRRYNFEDLFTVFQASGYQTLLQEDTCWHDEWGSILTGNRKLEKQDPHYRKKIWEEIRNLTIHHGIDSFGLTHMSCDVLANFGVTNLYNSNTMVCLNGEPLSSYFLDHILDSILTRTITTDSMPLLSYTHINIAHESSGTRIIGLDKHLEHFVSALGVTSNTLTIMLSDHGAKTSEYFMDTLPGRFEVYDPFLFMIVPKQLKEIVSDKNIQNLIDNQNSLIDMIDIRSMLLTLNTILNDKKAAESRHLFTNSIKNRADCEHISIRNYALCKCLSNVTFPNKEDDRYKEFIIWLGEYAVGYLNNKLASQQLTSKSGHRCSRIIANKNGDSIKNIIERRSSKGVTYLFDVSTKHDDNTDVFNFQILFNEKRNEKYELLQVEHWMRVSIYSRYASCKDRNVSYEICMCSDYKREKIDRNYISNYKQFETGTDSISLLNRTCAFLLKRTNLYVVTFELANMCEQKVDIEFSTKVKYSWVASQSLPLQVGVKPYTIQFLVTFVKVVDSNEDIKPNIIIRN